MPCVSCTPEIEIILYSRPETLCAPIILGQSVITSMYVIVNILWASFVYQNICIENYSPHVSIQGNTVGKSVYLNASGPRGVQMSEMFWITESH